MGDSESEDSMTRSLDQVLERRSEEAKEDLSREKRNYGTVRPPEAQVGTKTWKSYSKIRYASEAFRAGYDRIFGKSD